MNRDEPPIGDGDAPTVPWSAEAEQSVLGGLMLDNTAWDRAGGALQPREFFSRSHTEIYEAIGSPLNGGKPADVRPRNAIREPAKGVHEPFLQGARAMRVLRNETEAFTARIPPARETAASLGEPHLRQLSLVPGDKAPRASPPFATGRHMSTPSSTTCFGGDLKRVYRGVNHGAVRH